MGIGGIVSALVSVFHNGTAMPMVGVMTGCIFVGIAVLLAGRLLLRDERKYSEDSTVVI